MTGDSPQLIQVDQLLAEFYAKPFTLSYSGLSKLLYSPSLYFKHYILQQKEDRLDSFLVDGKVIHCLILDDGSFDKDFMLTPGSLPTGNTRIVVDKVYALYSTDKPELRDYSTEIVDILKAIPLHQALTDDKKADKDGNQKTGDEKRLEKIITNEAVAYWEFLKIRGDKTLVDPETLLRCNESVDALRLDDNVCHLLGLLTNEMENVDIFNEVLLFAETETLLSLKGVIDNIKVDHDNKVIYINDLKTSGKSISDFKESVEYFNYWVQAAIYERLVYYKFSDLIKEDWKVMFNFIVIDKYRQVYTFEVTPETMQTWQIKLQEKLVEAEWHYINKNYVLPFEFAVGKVTL